MASSGLSVGALDDLRETMEQNVLLTLFWHEINQGFKAWLYRGWIGFTFFFVFLFFVLLFIELVFINVLTVFEVVFLAHLVFIFDEVIAVKLFFHFVFRVSL